MENTLENKKSMLKTPLVIINVKTYEEATGEKAVILAKVCEECSKETEIAVAIAVQTADLHEVAKMTDGLSGREGKLNNCSTASLGVKLKNVSTTALLCSPTQALLKRCLTLSLSQGISTVGLYASSSNVDFNSFCFFSGL